MALESVSRIVSKVDHWPLAKQRHYLTLAVQTEKGERRRQIEKALKGITTRVLRQELRGRNRDDA